MVVDVPRLRHLSALVSGRTIPKWIISDSLIAASLLVVAVVVLLLPGQALEPTPLLLTVGGPIALVWRRISPMAALLTTAGCFFLYDGIGYVHDPLPFALLVALYTVAARTAASVSAVACGVLTCCAMGSDVVREGWRSENFDQQLFGLVLAFAAVCALGYGVQLTRARNQLLNEQAARLASEHAIMQQHAMHDEHARIARELHDVVAHQVSVITALAAGADRVIDSEPAKARWALNSIEAAGREALAEMRRLLRVLRADAEDDARVPQPGLADLAALIARTERAGVPVELSVQGEPDDVPTGIQMCAYRIVQEALTNVLKHAGPARAWVTVSYTDTDVQLSISDNGVGMRSAQVRGHGIIGMKERAGLVGGRLSVEPSPSGGVQVSASLPIHADDEEGPQ